MDSVRLRSGDLIIELDPRELVAREASGSTCRVQVRVRAPGTHALAELDCGDRELAAFARALAAVADARTDEARLVDRRVPGSALRVASCGVHGDRALTLLAVQPDRRASLVVQDVTLDARQVRALADWASRAASAALRGAALAVDGAAAPRD